MSGVIGQQGRTRPSVTQPTPTATPAGPLTGTVQSASAKKIADRSGKAGLVAAAEITRVGAPSERSGSQRIASYLKKKGFGSNWEKRVEDQARELLIASERQRVGSPNYGNKDYIPNDADLKETSYRLAMEQANRIDNPKARDVAQQLVSDTYGVEPSGKLQKGVVKSDKPRKGLLGEGAEGTREEKIKELGARKRVRLANQIAQQGITDDVLKADIEEMRRAEAEGDTAAYTEAERRFNQRLNANLAIEPEEGISVQDPTRQSNRRVSDFTREESGRTGIYGERAKGDEPGRQSLEGKAVQDAPQMSRDALDVLAADQDLTDKLLDRFSDIDKTAVLAKFKKIKDDPNSDAAQMTRADLLRTFNKALSIEGMVKAQTILGQIGSPAAKRAAKMQEVRDATPPVIARAEKREQMTNIRSAMKVIESVMGGSRKYDSRSGGREAMTADIGSVMRALNQYVPGNRVFQDRMQGQVRKSFGMAAAGNMRPLGEIMKGLQMLGQKAPPSIEEQVGDTKGDVPQLAAMMTGVGNRIRGGASTARAKPGARNVLTGKRLKKGVAPAAEPLGLVAQGEKPALKPGQYYADYRDQEVSKGKKPGPRQPVQRVTDNLDAAFDQFMADAQSEALGKGDVRMQGRDAETMGKTRRVAASRLRSLMDAYKDETKDLDKQKDIGEIRDAKQLASAQKDLAALNREIADGKKRLDNIRRYIAPRESRDMFEDVRRRVPVDQGDDFRPPSEKRRFMPQTQDAETMRDYRAALEGRIKVLQGRVTMFERELARATEGKGIGPKVMSAAVREGGRQEMPVIRQKGTPKQKVKSKARSTPPLSEVAQPTVRPGERDERAFTGGKFVKGVRQEPGRKQSEPVKRAMRGKRMKLKKTQKPAYIERMEDVDMVRRAGLAGLLEGLPA
jgi:hypothetical protein